MHVELDEPDGVTASAAKLTSEQLRIVNHKFEPGHTVKVIALAGNFDFNNCISFRYGISF